MLRIYKKGKNSYIETNVTLRKPVLEITIWDRNHRIVDRFKVKIGSYLKNFALLLKSLIEASSVSVVNTAGETVTITGGDTASHSSNGDWLTHSLTMYLADINSPAGDDSYGIVIGNGTASVSPTDYALQSKIPNGTGSGQLSYDAHSFSPITSGGGVTSFSVVRSFANNSGGDISVSEVGIIIYHRLYEHDDRIGTVYNETQYVLIIRDVFSTRTVPDGGGITVKYTFSIGGDFTEWFVYMLYGMFKKENQTITDVSGSSVTLVVYYSKSVNATGRYTGPAVIPYLLAGDDDDSFGIVVGTGVTAFDQSQSALLGKIPQGTGSGQLDYNTHTTYDLEELTDKFRIKITRTFYNGSGATITVNEVGLYVHNRVYFSDGLGTYINTDIKYMVARKVATQSIEPDGTLNVHWYIAIPK